MIRPLRLFVTGTDTGVGKTEVSCALLSLLAQQGARPAAFKPYETGVAARGVPADAARMREAAGNLDPLDQVCLHRLKEPLAPAVAAQREGRRLSFAQTLRGAARFQGRPLVVEGAGGLFVPLDPRHEVVDLISALELPVVLVARAGLGTLNHVALSLEALEARNIMLAAVVLSQSTPATDPSMADNRAWIARRHKVRVLGPVPFFSQAAERSAAFQRALAPLVSGGKSPAPGRKKAKVRTHV